MKTTLLFIVFIILYFSSEVKCQDFSFRIKRVMTQNYDEKWSELSDASGFIEIYSDRVVVLTENETKIYPIRNFSITENNDKYIERTWWCSNKSNQNPNEKVEIANAVIMYLYIFKTHKENTFRIDPMRGFGKVYALEKLTQ